MPLTALVRYLRGILLLMRKWLFLLGILAIVYFLSQINRRKKDRSSFFKRLDETLTLLVWTLLAAYTVVFLYWVYTQIFK